MTNGRLAEWSKAKKDCYGFVAPHRGFESRTFHERRGSCSEQTRQVGNSIY